jgi:hypothetical protein
MSIDFESFFECFAKLPERRQEKVYFFEQRYKYLPYRNSAHDTAAHKKQNLT